MNDPKEAHYSRDSPVTIRMDMSVTAFTEFALDRHGFSANILSIPTILKIYLTTYDKKRFNLLNFGNLFFYYFTFVACT